MARPPRIEYAGAFYHVIVRGNHRQNIFVDDHDRHEYLSRVRHYKSRCGFVLYAYVLMDNHVHLLIETPKAPLSKIMQLINFTYTRHFNRKYAKVGHLFQGRYKAILCDRDEYLLALVRYIHLNPVRAKMVGMPHEYPWSSHTDYLRKQQDIIDSSRVLLLFSENISRAVRLYEEFVGEAIGEGRNESFYQAVEQQILGGEEFVDKVDSVVNDPERSIYKPSLQAILQAVENVTGLRCEDILSRSRKREIVIARSILVGAWREVGYKMVELQPVLKRDQAMLSRLSNLSVNDQVQGLVKKVLKKLKS